MFTIIDSAIARGSVWVSGPPGAGKTALVASYIEARSCAHVWYLLDAGDDDLAGFFHYLTLALAPHQRGGPLPPVQTERLAQPVAFARDYFRAAFERFGAPALLVFDNYHELPPASRLHEVLEQAAAQAPSGSGVVFVSREAPPAQFARLQASERLSRIEWDELKLTLEEASAIAMLRSTLSAPALRQLFALSQGWVAGLTLALERMKRDEVLTAPQHSAALDTVFDYFASQILQAVAPEVREFLIRSALLRHPSAVLAQQITGNAAAAEILEGFHRRRLFVDRRGEGVFTYQFHDLFRTFLLRQLEQLYTPPGIAELKLRAAHALEQAGEPGDAVALYQQAEDWNNVARLIKAHAEQMVQQGRWQTLQGWFTNFPQEQLDADDELLLWSGLSSMSSEPRVARERLERAKAMFAAAHDAEGMVRALFGLNELLFILKGPLASLDPIKQVLEQIIESGVSLSATAQLQAHRVYLDIAVVRGGRNALVARTIEALQQWAQAQQASLPQRDKIYDGLLLYSVFAADEHCGATASATLRRLEREEDAPPTWRYYAARNLGFWRYFRAEPDYGLRDFDRAIELADRWYLGLQAVVARVYRVLALTRGGHESTARAELAALAEFNADMGAFRDGYVAFAQAIVAASSGDLARAAEHADTMVRQMRAAGFTLLEMMGRNLQAAYALRLGRGAQALACVRALRALVAGSTWRRYDAFLLSVEAEVAWRSDDADEAAALLHALLPLTRNRVMAAALVESSDWVPRQLAQALEAGIEPEAARALIRDFNLAPPSSHAQHWPWRVKIFVLGRFALLSHDAPIAISRKAPKKPLALLQALICQGGGAVSVARLIDWLWPEAEADAAKKSFEMALSRLRTLLGDASMLTLERAQLSLNRDKVWVDAWAFSELARQSRSAPAAQGATAPRLAAQAVRLYAGSLLPQELDAAWSVTYRERLRDSFNCLIREQAAELEAAQQHADALALYLRGLEADDLVEAMHQGVMRCHLRLGQRADALAAFQRLRRTLATKLRTSPSAESAALASAAQAHP